MADINNSSEVHGRYSTGNAQEEAFKAIRSKFSGVYSGAVGTLATGQSLKALSAISGFAAFFTNLEGSKANYIEIFSDVKITLSIATAKSVADGVATNALQTIVVYANTLRTISYLADITEIYITNASGSTSNLEVVGV